MTQTSTDKNESIDLMRQPQDRRPRMLHGRREIVTPYEEVTDDNLLEILHRSLADFWVNRKDIDYLWRYYKGRQPILDREKEVRPEICNTIVENHAQEIIAFKVGYQLAEPLQYTCRNSTDEGYSDRLEQVNELNTMMFAEDKASADRDLFEWMCVGGVGYRLVESDTEADIEEGGAPFEIYTLDPRQTFVVRSGAYHKRPLMGVWVSIDPVSKDRVYNIYTDRTYYRIKNDQIVEKSNHTYGRCPIVEYQLNNARMGVFEPALPLLDAINNAESNRLDSVEQTVQSLMVFVNCDITQEDYQSMREQGAIKIDSRDGITADVKTITTDLDQGQTQTTKDDLYDAVLNICGMPSRTSTAGADTGAAVILRDGWSLAESHAKSFELQIKRAEREMLRVILNICKQSSDTDIDLRIRDIELVFNRRNYENILTKSQVLTTMLSSDQIHPELAFQACGLFSDPDAAYSHSVEYTKGEQKAQADKLEKQIELEQAKQGNDKAQTVDVEKQTPQAGVPEPTEDKNNSVI